LFRRRVIERVIQGNMDLEDALWELEDRSLVYRERVIPEEEYSFKHVLTQEAVYHNIPSRHRARFHRKVAEAIEGLYRDGLDEYYEQLAFHYERSGNVEKAIGYLVKAGEKAIRSFANEAAITHFQKGLELLKALPDTLERARQELDFQIDLGPALIATKGYAASEVEGAYPRAAGVVPAGGRDPSALPGVAGTVGILYSAGGATKGA